MNRLLSTKGIDLSTLCYAKLHLFVMREHVFIITKHLMDKHQQLFDKQKHLPDNKQHLATSNMKDGQKPKVELI